MRLLPAIAAACLLLAACTTTDVKSVDNAMAVRPTPGAKILIVQPDIELNLLTAAGMQEPRADWSRSAQDNVEAALEAAVKSRSHSLVRLDPDTAMEGRTGQIIRLNTAVGNSILLFNYGAIKLPTKTGAFDWTLGDGAHALADTYGADYALFVHGAGSYSSAGRKALMVGMAALGASLPMGGQQAFASLVDLKTGKIVWFNLSTAAPSADMRTTDGATTLTASLLKDLPL
ncbi:MAG: hypothetical protein JWM33_837 [Caulobacteraceae bacterium]|nr:hypothetical protein [Caulobacteraceae bacterium]